MAGWRIVDMASGEAVARRRFEQRRDVADAGYDALVAAETALLGDLARAMADSLRGLPLP